MEITALNLIVGIAPWAERLQPKNQKTTGWVYHAITLVVAVVGGLGCAYLIGDSDPVATAIATYAGSKVFSGVGSILLNPQPYPPGNPA